MSYSRIIELLEEKHRLIKEMEQVTEPMYYEEEEVISECMEIRAELFEEIEAIDAEIKHICSGDEALRAALNNSCDRQNLNIELAQVYDSSTKVFAVVNRMIKNNSTVEGHLIDEKSRIEEKIKDSVSSGYAVADQYHKSVSTGMSRFAPGKNGIKI